MGWQWYQLDHMQIICTSLQTDNHTNTSSLIFRGRMLFLTPNQQCQSTEGIMSIQTRMLAINASILNLTVARLEPFQSPLLQIQRERPTDLGLTENKPSFIR